MASEAGTSIYESDPGPPPDSAFLPGALRHLVPGREGRLLDPRRTPVRVLSLDLRRGLFEVEVRAFEDKGARWLVPFESCVEYQFAPGEDAPPVQVAELEDAVRRLDRPLAVPANPAVLASTRRRLATERGAAEACLDAAGISWLDIGDSVRRRSGHDQLFDLLEDWLGRDGLDEMDARFAGTFVSNPGSGELVKGHALVLAELGLCPFAGKVVRDPELFQGEGSKERRAVHILRRMAFVQALFARVRPQQQVLYRGMHLERQVQWHFNSFVSATFSLEVAFSNFQAGPASSSGILLRQPLPIDRLFMTFLETRALSRQYREAEAVLVGTASEATF